MSKFLTDTLAKISQNIYAYSFVSEHSKYFLLYLEKNLDFLAAGMGSIPPPLADASAKNAIFYFLRSSLLSYYGHYW